MYLLCLIRPTLFEICTQNSAYILCTFGFLMLLALNSLYQLSIFSTGCISISCKPFFKRQSQSNMITQLLASFFLLALVLGYQTIRIPLKQKSISWRPLKDKRDTYQESIYPSQNSIYLVTVCIGTPPQAFDLVLDTGGGKISSDLWVPGSDCPDSVCPFEKYNQSQSNTFQDSSERFNISYGTGRASGKYGYDSVIIAGAKIRKQQFGQVDYQEKVLSRGNSNQGYPNGIFGLGYPFIAASTYQPFFFNLESQLKNKLFSIYLNCSDRIAGQILFGGIDTSMYHGELHYLPLALTQRGSRRDYGYWQVYGQSIGLVRNQTTSLITLQSPRAFLFDTGTTMSYMPRLTIENILNESLETQEWAFDPLNHLFQVTCNMTRYDQTFVQLQLVPTAHVQMNPVMLHLPLSELVLPLDSDRVQSASVCMLGLLPSERSIFIGQSILRSIYTVYDVDQHRLGIAAANGSQAFLTGPAYFNSSSTSFATRVFRVFKKSELCAIFIVYFIL
ncbi:aspartic peptidase domain-containing protein [Sporodiniella umbellata]|nr:aspartic peptidase domain-containing protein [Sporodiniella umbellata]